MIYSAMVVVCLVVIWFVLGLMMWKMYCSSGKNARARRTQDQPVHSTASARTAVGYSPISGTITIDLPTGEDGPRPDGVKEERAAGQGESCSSGSNDGSHSTLSNFHSLKSNEEAERVRKQEERGITVSKDSSTMSEPKTLASTEDAVQDNFKGDSSTVSQPKTLASTEDAVQDNFKGDSSTVSQPKTLASTEDAVQDNFKGDSSTVSQPKTLASTEDALQGNFKGDSSTLSQPGTLASTEDADRDAFQMPDQFLQVDQSLIGPDSGSELSSFHSLRSSESPDRRNWQVYMHPPPSLPAILRIMSDWSSGSSDANRKKNQRWHSV